MLFAAKSERTHKFSVKIENIYFLNYLGDLTRLGVGVGDALLLLFVALFETSSPESVFLVESFISASKPFRECGLLENHRKSEKRFEVCFLEFLMTLLMQRTRLKGGQH